MEELKITDNGETEVQIATVGQVIGSDRDGNPVEQNFTKESFDVIAANLSSEILVDKDHASLKPGVEKDSEAMGWLSDVKANESGLFGKIKWTELGRKLIESRAFRFLSPVFKLNANKEPEKLVNVAITNMPSQQAIKPIINSYSDMGQLIVTTPEVEEDKEDFNENSNNKGMLKMEITKEELAEMVKAMIETYLESAKTEEVKEEVKEEEVVENTCTETKEEDEVANTESTEETKSEETKSEEEVKAEEKKEVIQVEALNSAPTFAVSVAEVSDFEKALDASLQNNGGHFTRI